MHLEPTYLRYIYDGLVKGSIHPENAAELPDGLIGLYEEAFDERTSVIERQKLLQRFAIWALLKKEVSVAFVAEVLNETEDDIQEFISTYSAWFNSPESGKYQLYHERLKVFLLQKLSEGEVSYLNGLLCVKLQSQLVEKIANEFAYYCYEFLSFHTFLNAHLTNEVDKLSELCLNNEFKLRQFEISGFYNWEEQLMLYGIEYFSIRQEQICHQLVFEKTKIDHKKKDINLILDLIEKGELELVYSFFKSTYENLLQERIVLAYFYALSFFKVFEMNDWSFSKKKDVANNLLELFEDNFKWDKGYYLAQFIDVNISFRLHCYFLQFGLDFNKFAIFSSDHKSEFYAMNTEGTLLKFIKFEHKEEATQILKNKKDIYDYSFDFSSIENLFIDEEQFTEISKDHQDTLIQIGKHKLFSQSELTVFIEDEIDSFNYLIACLIFALGIIELPRQYKIEVFNRYKECINTDSDSKFLVSGHLHRNDLKIIKSDKKISSDQNQILDLLTAESFGSMDSKSRFETLNNVVFSDEFEVDLLLAFLDLSLFFDGNENNDILDLFSSLFIEFILDTDEDKIMLYSSKLFDSLVNMEHHSEEFEDKIFDTTINFFKSNDFNGYSKSTLLNYKESILDLYFDFNFYNYSFKQGIALINLFNQHQIDFPEEEIIERILEDLDAMIEENDYNEMWVIESSGINGIYNKPYFKDFYSAVKRIEIEKVQNELSEYIFNDIIRNEGLNQSLINYFFNNSSEYPGMYIQAKKALSEKISESNFELSYLPIKDSNELLSERLLLNIVSNRKQLQNDLNIEIIKYYSLNWVLELDREYVHIISKK